MDECNTRVQEILAADATPIHVLYSYDTKTERLDGEKDMFSHKILDTMNAPDAPPHTLKFRVGDLVFLTRNYSMKAKLTNNSKHEVIQIDARRHVIIVRALATGLLHVIHRINFHVEVKSKHRDVVNFTLLRRQFPLRLCYAMTIDKSQGQTLQRVGLDLREHAFSHGQIYVAYSRVMESKSILTLVEEENRSKSDPDSFLTVNVVHKSLLLQSRPK